jgi:uncharacterized protein (DUF427 family)
MELHHAVEELHSMVTQPLRPPLNPGQESVWDYPRPPRVEISSKHVKVVFNGVTIAETDRAVRVLETSHPPVFYIPLDDVKAEYLREETRHTYCEFKGTASYYSVSVNGKKAMSAAWYYPNPTTGFEAIANYVAFYPQHMDACYVDNEKVQQQESNFYGGWITSEIVGPYKGAPGTSGW